MADTGPSGDGQQDWVYHVAAQLASADINAEKPAGGSGGRRWLIIGAVVAVLAVGGGIAAAIAGSGDDNVTTSAATTVAAAPTLAPASDPPVTPATTSSSLAPTTATPTTAAPTTAVASGGEASTSTSAASTTTSTTAAPTTTAVAVPTTVIPAEPSGELVRWAEYADGAVTLLGRVPDQATADTIATRAEAVVGAGNVTVAYVIDPTAPRPDEAPLYVNTSFLFAPGRSDFSAEAQLTLDLAVSLMSLYPKVTIDVEGHTDSDGSDADNLALSQRRADAFVAYLVDHGIDPSRMTSAAKGETEPIADNSTPAGKAANRRLEITVNHLLA